MIGNQHMDRKESNVEIKILDDMTVRKIAAGEVVEKPAMIVKELIENALDAEATEICVEIDLDRIWVSDNGTGIEPDQLPLAFERHATSKISALEDLYQTTSYGFRGEALASIAAVSNVRMHTKTAHHEGVSISVDGGHMSPVSPVARNRGTTVEVTNLFYNTPVRKKFLKTKKVEQSYINKTVELMAIANHHVSIDYLVNGERMFMTDGKGDLLSAIYSVFGRTLAQHMNYFEGTFDSIKIYGVGSSFSYTKGNSAKQYIFVNGRVVRSPEMKEAINTAYKSNLMNGRFPVVFLFINLSPSSIDVNIHPAKSEIKFECATELKQLVYTTLRKSFNKYNQTHFSTSTLKEPSEIQKPVRSYIAGKKNELNQMSYSDQLTQKSETEKKPIPQQTMDMVQRKTSLNETKSMSADFSVIPAKVLEQESLDMVKDPSYEGYGDQIKIIVHEEPFVESKEVERIIYHDLNPIGVYERTYILCESIQDDHLYLIDQHAAHEKILYEQFMKQVRTNEIATQPILVPILIESGNELQWDRLLALGFEFDVFGDHEIAIRSIPACFGLDVAKAFAISVVEDVEEEVDRHTLASKACKAAIKAHDAIQPMEIKTLLMLLTTLEDPYNCPHGRPIVIAMTKKEIEKRFKRIV